MKFACTTIFLITQGRFRRLDDVMKIAVLAGVLFGISGVCTADGSTLGLSDGEASFSHRISAPQRIQIVEKFEAKNENVREVLRSLFKKVEVVGYNIDPTVQGNVTVNLSQVPFTVVLEAVLRQVNARYRVESEIWQVLSKEKSPSPLSRISTNSGIHFVTGDRAPLSSPIQKEPVGMGVGEKLITIGSGSDEDIRDFLSRIFSEAYVSFVLSPKIEGKAYCTFNSMMLKDVLAFLGEVHGFHAELRAGCYVLQPTLQVAMNLAPSKSSRILVLDGGTVELMAPPRASTAGKLPAKRLRSVPVADEITALFRQMNAKCRISPNLPKISGNLPSESKASRLYRLKNLANVSVKLKNGVYVVRPK